MKPLFYTISLLLVTTCLFSGCAQKEESLEADQTNPDPFLNTTKDRQNRPAVEAGQKPLDRPVRLDSQSLKKQQWMDSQSLKEQQWKHFVAQWKKEGYTLMSMRASQSWIDNVLPSKSGKGGIATINVKRVGTIIRLLGDDHRLLGDDDSFLTVDHNGTLRVFRK